MLPLKLLVDFASTEVKEIEPSANAKRMKIRKVVFGILCCFCNAFIVYTRFVSFCPTCKTASEKDSWLTREIKEIGRDVAAEVESDWLVPLLVEEERERLMAWQLGVSL